jgi:hypothetical protein
MYTTRSFSGYDVWLNNIRGNTYSKNHTKYDSCVSCGDFWEFRYLEIGVDFNLSPYIHPTYTQDPSALFSSAQAETVPLDHDAQLFLQKYFTMLVISPNQFL